MHVINLRPLRLPLLIAGVLILAWVIAAFPIGYALVNAYDQATFVSGTWGAGSGEFGHGLDRLGREQGPRAFAVGIRGDLYVADTHNHRILYYSAAGDMAGSPLIQLAADEFPTHIAVDAKGMVYVALDGKPEIRCYNRNGKEAGGIALAQGVYVVGGDQGEWTLLGLWGNCRTSWFTKGGGVYAYLCWYGAEGGESKVVYAGKPGEPVTEVFTYAAPQQGAAQAAQPMPEGICSGPRGELAISTRNGPFAVRVSVHSTSGKAVWQANVVREAVIGGSMLIGGDGKGGFYLALEYGTTAEVVRVSQDSDPQVVATILTFRPRPEAGDNSPPYLATPARVDVKGRIYVALADVNGLAITRLNPRTTIKRR